MSPRPTGIIVCINDRFTASKPSCARGGSVAIADALEQAIAERGLALTLERLHCLGECALGPNLRLAPGGRFFHHVKLADIPAILDEIEKELG
ncbi:MAG: (2Fe-2S) ferredoxin domain-containing protein [Alphaproteobacteria bacterium]|nr:(2Fe-2S) ferredoxin domain-containing protein [Alphaproteobacteria bacterium]MBF0354603.1 (2Fe-2S) ferredoxin domain-containing protein [Alphaproteobacteria bacterium]